MKTNITDTLIYDGTGGEPFYGSVIIKDDIIADIVPSGRELPFCENAISGKGLICTPGFIDIHRHADYFLFNDDFGRYELSQGLTTVINGNCGMSGAPVSVTNDTAVEKYQESVLGKIPNNANTENFHIYAESIRSLRPALNVATLVGLGTLAAEANGIHNKLFANNLPTIHRGLEMALEEGAAGVSLGLGYKPAFSYTTDEIISCLAPIKNTDIPVTVHMRQEGDGMLEALQESIRIASTLGVPFEISHLKAIGTRNWQRTIPKAITLLKEAISAGINIGWDVYPYTAGSTQLIHVLPPEICGREAEALKDDNLYAQAERRILYGTDYENIIKLCGYKNIYPGKLMTSTLREFNGLSLYEGALKAEMPPFRWLLTILSEENTPPSMIDFITCESDITYALQDSKTVIISDSIYPSDGHYHPRVAGTYSRIIEKYVMRDKTLSMQNAIRQMTSLPAQRMHIKNRGVLKANCQADLCLFDPKNIHENSDYGKSLIPSCGMKYVFVNGIPALVNGEIKYRHAGCCL